MVSGGDLNEILQRFVSRYRTAVAAKAAVLGGLSLLVLGLLGWRLYALDAHPGWRIGLPTAFALMSLGCLTWWTRRHWVSRHGAAAQLDRALGLQQRLITAEEFSHAQEQPALYTLLVEDAARRTSPEQTQFPRPLDRTAGMLAIVLLLLLLWPGAGSNPLQLLQRPQHGPPEPPSPQQSPPPDQQQHDESRQQEGASSQPSESSGQDGSGPRPAAEDRRGGQDNAQQPSGKEGQKEGQQEKGGQQETKGQGQEAGGEQTGRDQQQAQGRDGQEKSEGQQRQSAGRNKQDAQGSQPPSSGQDQQQGAQGEKGSSSDRGLAQQRAAQRGGKSGADTGQGRSPQQSEADGKGGPRPAAQDRRGGQTPGAGDDALKAEIQQLLKEMSGELKQLQEQMTNAKDQPQPQAGTSTDPNLYEAPTPLDRATGDALPIQLNTDSHQTKTPRPGSGVGKPSADASSAAPQTRAEAAQLADTPQEETPTARQPIPPEYRSIFDQLRRRRTQPSETKQ